jgi:lupus La protein
MRRFKPYEAVVKALKESNFFVIDGPEGEETIRRKNAVDLEKRTKREERSVYVKGFGDETKSTQFDVEAFFAQYGQFDSVRLRRDVEDPEKPFKGSVFVEWSDKDTAEKFMNQDPQPQWHGHPLNILWKLDYMRQKNEAIRDGKINSRGPRGRGNHRGQRGNARGNDRGADKNDWKKRRDQDQQNGFNDRRGNNRGGRDRGGRGRGRGRGNFRGRGGRDNQGDRDQDAPVKPADDGRPKIHVSKEGAKIMEQEKAKSGETNGKRARDEDASAGSPPAKKVDTKV